MRKERTSVESDCRKDDSRPSEIRPERALGQTGTDRERRARINNGSKLVQS